MAEVGNPAEEDDCATLMCWLHELTFRPIPYGLPRRDVDTQVGQTGSISELYPYSRHAELNGEKEVGAPCRAKYANSEAGSCALPASGQ